MSDAKLGQIIQGSADRDAIHIAIAPITSDEYMVPGEHVGIENGKASSKAEPIGIVDPFLKSRVEPGQRFYLLLYQKTVSSLRHDWSHPAFKAEPDQAREFIAQFASKWNYSYEDLMEGAKEYLRTGEYMDDQMAQLDIEDAEWIEFWTHFHNITGLAVPGNASSFITCCP